MSLASRCPDCKTLNQTTAALLQAQNGHLTCSACGKLFSGIDHLAPADEDSWSIGQHEPEDGASAGAEALHRHPADGKRKRRFTLTPAWLSRKMSGWPRFARRGAALFGALLVVQLIWWQRLAIATTIPALSPAITAWSRAVGADVAGPASTRLKILASSLKTAQDNRLQLELRVRNAAQTHSRWPTIDLHLLDSKRNTVTSITLRVADYAVAGQDEPSRTLAPGQDAEIIAWVDTTVLNSQTLELPVTGFKVTLADAGSAAQSATKNPGKPASGDH